MHGPYSNFLYVLLLNLQLKAHKMSGSFPSGTESGVSGAAQPTGSDSASSSNTLANPSYPVDMENRPTTESQLNPLLQQDIPVPPVVGEGKGLTEISTIGLILQWSVSANPCII